MVHVLYDSVDYVGQLAFFIKLAQLVEIFAKAVVFQRVLNVTADSGINVFSSAFVITEGYVIKGGIGIIEYHIFHLQSATVLNIFVNRVDSKQSRIFSEGNEGCVDHDVSVIQLVSVRHSKSKRIGSRYHDFHAHRRKQIRKQRGCSYEVIHQCYFIDEYVFAALIIKRAKILGQHRHIIGSLDFDICGLFYRKLADHLEQKRRFTRSAKTVKCTDLSVNRSRNKFL